MISKKKINLMNLIKNINQYLYHSFELYNCKITIIWDITKAVHIKIAHGNVATIMETVQNGTAITSGSTQSVIIITE